MHHRVLNNKLKLRELSSKSRMDDTHTQMAEGDLCWYVQRKKVIAYLWHPDVLFPLKKDALHKKIKCGQVVLLEDILSSRVDHIPYILELKGGYGDTQTALTYILRLLEEHKSNNYWVDSFSPSLLKQVKKISPGTITSLHTKMVIGKWLFKSALEKSPIGLLSISSLPFVDIITATYKTSLSSILKIDVDVVHKQVLNNNKMLVLGGIQNDKEMILASKSKAIACYPKYDR